MSIIKSRYPLNVKLLNLLLSPLNNSSILYKHFSIIKSIYITPRPSTYLCVKTHIDALLCFEDKEGLTNTLLQL